MARLNKSKQPVDITHEDQLLDIAHPQIIISSHHLYHYLLYQRYIHLHLGCGGFVAESNEKKKNVETIIDNLKNNTICMAGDGYVKDCRGSYSWYIALKESYSLLLEGCGPVDGDRNYIKLARTEASHILAMLTVIFTLQSHVPTDILTIPIYTDCLTVINYCKHETLNTPSTVMVDNIDIMIQIRHIIISIRFNIQFIHTQSSRIEGEYDPTLEEKLLLSRRDIAMQYYNTPDAEFPSQIPLQFPDLSISFQSNGDTIIHDFPIFLQQSE